METPLVPDSSDLRFRVRLRTRWVDEDNQSVLNNAIFMTLMEEGRHFYFSDLGLMEGNRFPFVLARANVHFVAPGRGAAEVDLEMGTTRLGVSSFEQAFRLRDAETGEVWCEATSLLVAWNNEERRKVPMSDEFRSAVARYEELD